MISWQLPFLPLFIVLQYSFCANSIRNVSFQTHPREGKNKNQIKNALSKYWDLNFTLDEIRPYYKFDETCQGTVPQAIVAFLEAESFEDAIRNAISIGGDSDTLAAITGSLAEAYYGIPCEMKKKALHYLDKYLRCIALS